MQRPVNSSDRDRLKRLGRLLEGREDALIATFYERVEADVAAAPFLPGGDALLRLRRMQRAYFHELLEARYDDAYRQRRVAVGRAHHRVGLPLRVYTESYGVYLALLLAETQRVLHGDPELLPTLSALVAAVVWDMGLVHEAWSEEQRHTLDALGRAHEALEVSARLDATRHLAGAMAHDLNNVLGAVADAAGSLRARGGGGEDLDLIESAAGRARRMVVQLLDVARTPKAANVPLDVIGLLRSFLPFLRRMLTDGVTLEVGLAPGRVSVAVDGGELERAVMNLVLNAQTALSGPGTIHLQASRERLDPEQAQARGLPPGRTLRLEVRDEGRGMSPALRARIFEPLFTTRGDRGGTGLGLAGVWSVVTQAGGTVEVESEEGRGSLFTVRLPTVDAPPEPRWGVTAGQGERLLLVEDDLGVGRATARLLGASGYDVVRAASFTEALEALDPDVDLVLTDFLLPGRSGVALVGALRERRPGLPILLRSGLPAEDVDPRGCLPADVPVLSKGLSPSELLAALREALDRGRAV